MWCHVTMGIFRSVTRRVRLEAALHRMISVWHQSTARAVIEQVDPMLSNHSRGTLMSYTDHCAQRRLKSNASSDYVRIKAPVVGGWMEGRKGVGVGAHIFLFTVNSSNFLDSNVSSYASSNLSLWVLADHNKARGVTEDWRVTSSSALSSCGFGWPCTLLISSTLGVCSGKRLVNSECVSILKC